MASRIYWLPLRNNDEFGKAGSRAGQFYGTGSAETKALGVTGTFWRPVRKNVKEMNIQKKNGGGGGGGVCFKWASASLLPLLWSTMQMGSSGFFLPFQALKPSRSFPTGKPASLPQQSHSDTASESWRCFLPLSHVLLQNSVWTIPWSYFDQDLHFTLFSAHHFASLIPKC